MKKATAAIIALLALVLCVFSGCTEKQKEDVSDRASDTASDIRDGASEAASDIRGGLTDASRDMSEDASGSGSDDTSKHDGNVGDENSDGRIDDTTDTKAESTSGSAS